MPRETAEYAVGLSFNAQGAERSVSRFGTAVGRATERLKEVVSQNGYFYYSMKRIASYTAIFTFFAGLGRLISEVVEMELRLAEVNTLIDKTNREAVDSFNEVSSALLRLDPHLGNAIDLTKGLYEIISAGVTSPAQAFNLLVTSAKYAKVGLTDLATASSTLTAVMKAYGFTAEAMREKSDVLFASVREGKFHTDELNAAIGKILPTAASMNVSIEEIVAALAVMTQRGLDVNEAATSLNRMLISFLRPIDKAKARFEALGWEYGRNAFESINLVGALKRLETASERYGDLLPTIFRRQRALKGGFILQGEGLKQLEAMYGRVTAATAGAGVVQQEFEMISGTVSMEIKALHANLLQGLSALLKYKGGVAAAVRDLSTLLRTVIEGAPTLMKLAGAMLIVRRIVKILGSEFVLTAIAQTHYNKAIAEGVVADEAAAIAKGKATAATKAARVALSAFNVVLLAVTVAYTAYSWWINRKKEEERKAAEAAERHAAAMRQVNDQIDLMNRAFEKAKGFQHDFSKAVESSAVWVEFDKMMKKITDTYEETKDLESAFYDFKEASKLDLPQYDKAWKAIKSILGLEGYDPNAMDKAWSLFRDMALESGSMQQAALEQSNNLRQETSAYGDVLDSMSQKLRAFARDLKLAITEMETDKARLALNYTNEELLDMAKALQDVQKELDPLQKRQLELVGINVEDLLGNPDKLRLAIQTYLEAAEDAFGAKSRARIEDYRRTALASMEDVTFTLQTATEKVRAYFLEFGDMRTYDRDDLVVWANKNATEIEKVLSWKEKLPQKEREFLERVWKWREEDKKKVTDWAKKYEDALKKVTDDREKMQSKIQTLQNEYMEQGYNNVVAQFEREKIAYINHAQDMLTYAIKSGKNQVEAVREFEESMLKIRQWGQEAQRVSQYKALQDFLKQQKSNLDAMKLNARERVRVSDEMAKKSFEYLRQMGLKSSGFLLYMGFLIKKFWGEIKDDAEAGINWLKEYEQFFRAVGTSISSTSQELSNFLELLGLSDTLAGRFASALGEVGSGFSNIAKHLKAVKESQDIGGLAGAIGQIGGVIGGVVAIASTAVSVFKKLFGGKTAEEKAKEEAERKKRELEQMVTQIQAAYKYLGDLSDSVAKKLAELRQGGVAGWLAEAKLLNEIMSDIGVTMKNFYTWSEKTIDVMYNIRDGFIGMEEGAEIVGDSFKQLTDYAAKWGIEGSRAILEMIWKAEELGVVIPEIADYIGKKLVAAATGLASAIVWVAKDAVEATDKIKELTKEKKKLLREYERTKKIMSTYEVGSEEYKEAIKKLNELGQEVQKYNKQINAQRDIILEHGKNTRKHISNLSVITAATFNAMMQSGRPLIEIMGEMKDSVFALMERYKALGLDVPAYLQPIFKIFRSFKKMPEVFEGIQGLSDTMKGLGDSGFMTADAFKALGNEAKQYFMLMKKGKDEGGLGFRDEQAIRMMYPLLQQMWWYAEQYGMKLPKWAKEAMNEAKGLGLKFEKPAVEKQLDILDAMRDIQKRRLGRTVALLSDIKFILRNTSKFAQGTPYTTGGFAHLHAGESVLPENITSALKQFFLGRHGSLGEGGSKGVAEVNVHMNGELFYKQLVPYIRKGGDYSDFEMDGDGVY